jgi:hypothetical protein
VGSNSKRFEAEHETHEECGDVVVGRVVDFVRRDAALALQLSRVGDGAASAGDRCGVLDRDWEVSREGI